MKISLLHNDKGTDVDQELVVDPPNVPRGREGNGDLGSGWKGGVEQKRSKCEDCSSVWRSTVTNLMAT